MKINAATSLTDIPYLADKPATLYPELPLHRLVASALPQHFGENGDKKRITLTGHQPLIEEMKKAITASMETDEDGTLNDCLGSTTIFESLLWPDAKPDEKNTGQMQVGCYASYTQAKSPEGMRVSAWNHAKRMIKECEKHNISVIPANLVGTGITTFSPLKNRPIDFRINRTFISINHQWLSFTFKVFASADFSFTVSTPKRLRIYPWYAQMLSAPLIGTYSRIFNAENN